MVALTVSAWAAAPNVTGSWTMAVTGGPHGDAKMALVLGRPVKIAISAFSTTLSWPMMTLLTSVRARVRMSLIWSVAVFIFSGKALG